MTEEEKNKIIEKEKLYFEEAKPNKKGKTVLLVFMFILFIGVTALDVQ